MEKGPERSGEDRSWIKDMLAKSATKIVSSQEDERVVLAAPILSGHKDAGTIRLDPEARNKQEAKKDSQKEECGAGKKRKVEGEKEGKTKGKKGKEKAKIFQPSPPVTRSRKRNRVETPENRTASQDSCTARNLHGGDTVPHGTFIDGEGYTPPLIQEAARMYEARKARIQVDLIRLLLDTDHPETKKAAQGILDLSRQDILKPGF